MKRPENIILRGETRLFLSILLAIILSVFAAANVFATPFAYITNQNSNTVSVIDTATNAVVATIPVGSAPVGVAVNPSGTRVYVTNRGSGNISVIDTNTNTVVATIPVGSGPVGVAVNPSGTRLYAANFNSNTVSVIDTATNIVTTIPVGSAPNDVAVNPSGTRLYVVNHLSSNVSVIDASTNTVVTTIPVGSVPVGVAVNPSGTRVYVTSDFSGKVSVIDTSTNTVVVTISVGSRPQGVAVNPSGTRVYVANHGSNAVSVIDTATNTVVATTSVGSGPVAFGKFIGPGAPVARWPGEGNANDVIGGHNGTLAGGVTFVPGKVGQAFKFDTSANSYITLPNSPDFMPASNQVTISAWIKPDFAVANHADIIFSKRDGCGSNRSYGLAVSKAGAIPLGYPLGTIVWSASVAGDDVTPSTTVPNDGQFHHIAGTYDGTVMRVYMDGVLIGGKPHTGPIPVTSAPPFIGLQSGCGSLSAAVIDEIEFRNRALSASEIQAVFNAGCVGMCEAQSCVEPPAGLVSWWPGDGNANDIQDGNNGTLVNGATFAAGMVGQAFSFDGVNDRVDVPDALSLDMTAAVTLDAWVKPNSFATCPVSGPFGTCAVVAKSSFLAGSRNYGMWILHDGRVHVEGGGFGRGVQTLPGLVPVGTFTHLAAVLTPPSVQIYVNGVPQPVTGSINPLTPNNVPLMIGASDIGTHNFNFNGIIDEVEIFNRALAASEIQAIFTAGSAGMCTAADTTPPTTTATPSPGPNANGWNNTNVAVTLNATDNEGGSGVKEIHYALSGVPETVVSGNSASVPISTEGTTVPTYFAKDNAGNTEGAKNLTVQIDKQPPVVSVTRTPTPNADGWNNTNVTVSFTATDTRSGIDGASFFDVFFTSEGANQSATRSFTDKAGNSTSATVSINIDRTAPTITGTASPAPNAAGWNKTDVTVSFTCADGLSGIGSCGPTQVVTTEGAGQSRMGTAVDKAGNSAPATVSGINIDKTAPVTTATLSPTPNGEWSNTNVSVTLAATDNLSGVARTEFSLNGAGWVTYTGAISLSAEGIHTLLYRSLDRADNLESARSLTIRIDKTPPEMVARCAPPGGSPFLAGRDGSSGMASILLTGSSAIRRGELKRQETYTILDKAGNRLEASFGVKAEGHETEFTLLSLSYNGGAQLTLPENELKCEWAVEKTGILKELEQKLEIGRAKSEVEAQAKFEGKKNETEIKVKTRGPGPDLRVTRPGLVFLNLTTNQGALGVDY